MNAHVDIQDSDVHAELSRLLEQGGLPDRIRQKGLRLLQRIGRPVRVTLMGPKGAGKTNVLNMLLGGPLIPRGLPSCDLQVHYADSPQITVTKKDGTTQLLEEFNIARAYAINPTSIHIGVPVEILRQLSIAEISEDQDIAKMSKSVLQAISRTDVCLWCSTGFTDVDQQCWNNVPDEHKDHAFLVLTQADKLAQSGILADVMDAIAPIVSQEFHSFFAVAARQGRTAWRQGKLVNPRAWAASGGAALMTALKAHAARGKQEEIDNARAYLEKYSHGNTKRPNPATLGEVSVENRREVQKDIDTLQSPEDKRAFVTIKGQLDAIAQNLGVMSDDPDDVAANAILQACSDMMADAVSTLSVGQESLSSFADDLDQAAEMITLLQLEGGMGPAADAVSILAQIQREVEYQIAA